LCRGVLNILASEDIADARELVAKDKAIDTLEKQLFEECVNLMSQERDSKAAGLIMYRCGRELERVGDLMKNIAEDLIYLQSGTIVRHEKKLLRQ
ncbi:MAG: PhoU domain-containing protein, partial [Phycisphaerales bacterium]|nr:PhoU domain-containing protein [Phycisphaerales bacterium]